MNVFKILSALPVICTLFSFMIYKPVIWKVKDNYSVKLLGIGGNFTGLKANIIFDESNPSGSKITATIDAKTISTGDKIKDRHAREELATDKFPLILFETTSIVKTDKGYEAKGKLTLKGITQEIKFPFVFDSQKAGTVFPFVEKETFSGKIIISLKEFNINHQALGEKAFIELTIPVTK